MKLIETVPCYACLGQLMAKNLQAGLSMYFQSVLEPKGIEGCTKCNGFGEFKRIWLIITDIYWEFSDTNKSYNRPAK